MPFSNDYAITCFNAPDELQQSINRAIGAVKPSNDNQTTDLIRKVYFFGETELESILPESAEPITVMAEIRKNHAEADIKKIAEYMDDYESIWLLTTKTAYINFTSEIICSHLKQRPFLNAEQYIDIVTALQEAVSNALIHGNLQVNGGFRTYEDLLESSKDIETKLQDDTYGQRAMWVLIRSDETSIEFTIIDEGDGYDYLTEKKKKDFASGSELISSLTSDVERQGGGRQVTLKFTVKVEQPNAKVEMLESINQQVLNSHILVVDDQPFNILILTKVLSHHGFTNITTATDGLDALAKMEKEWPDLIISDVMMPRMDGYVLCREVRQRDPLIPIIVQTGLQVAEERAQVFASGATDLVTKPVFADELMARVVLHLERKFLLDDLQRYQTQTRSELIEARTMQQELFPSKDKVERVKNDYGVSIHSFCQIPIEIGGDIWGVLNIDKKRFGIYLLDFAGHGIPAALNAFRIHAIIKSGVYDYTNPSQLLSGMNRRLCKLLPTGYFASMFYGVIDLEKNTLEFASAGAPTPLLVSKQEKKVNLLDSSGFPLGLKEDAKYIRHTKPYHKGDSLLLYSDALIETENLDNLFMDEKTLQKRMQELLKVGAEDANQVFNALVHEVEKGYLPQLSDDLTLNLYTRTG